MKKGAKRTARLALLTALGVVLLYLACVLPSARMATTAVAGFLTAIALMMYGPGWGALVYAATAALGLLILPGKGCAIYYAAFFGYYPIAKSLFERLKSRALGWVLKCLLYTAAFAAWWLLADVVLDLGSVSFPWYLAWPAGAAIFVVYDVCMTKLIQFYLQKIAGVLK